jgi:hypothetical protein
METQTFKKDMIFLSFNTIEKQKYRIQAEKSDELLKILDKFLKKNKIKIASIKDWKVDFSKEKSITSQRISQSILHALKF